MLFFFLKQFSFDIAEEASKVCLAHLFTYQDFDMGTLGLAYVGSPRANSHGGVCPKGKFPFVVWLCENGRLSRL